MADRRTPQIEGAGHMDAKSNGTGNSASTTGRDDAATGLGDREAMTHVRRSGTEIPPAAIVQGEKEICWYCSSG